MHQTDFIEEVKKICAQDPRFDPEAYVLVREALDYTTKLLQKATQGPERHVSGQDLLDGMRRYVIEQYGPMALTVLSDLGLSQTEDVGAIVFNLVDAGILGKTEEDSAKDFAGGYDFHSAFAKPFLPPDADPGNGPHSEAGAETCQPAEAGPR